MFISHLKKTLYNILKGEKFQVYILQAMERYVLDPDLRWMSSADECWTILGGAGLALLGLLMPALYEGNMTP